MGHRGLDPVLIRSPLACLFGGTGGPPNEKHTAGPLFSFEGACIVCVSGAPLRMLMLVNWLSCQAARHTAFQQLGELALPFQLRYK